MSNTIPAIVKEDEVVLFLDGDTKVINDGHRNYLKIRAALAAEDYDGIRELIDLAEQIRVFGDGKVTVEAGLIMHNGKAVNNVLADRILDMESEGFNVDPMVAFLNNLMENPSYRAVTELYGFLEETDLPITEDGCFIAYKMVRDNYTDNHTGTFDNSIGAIVEMDRNEVNDDKDQTCSAGLHFCSQGYLGFYGSGRTMILKVNPRDVVSIPTDYNNAKGRACMYEVIGELETKPTKEHSFDTTVFEDGEMVMSFSDAADALCGHTMDAASALCKRVYRGTVEVKYIDGQEMVVVKDSQRTDGFVREDDDTVSMEEAAETLCGGTQNPTSALKKRISRGSVATKLVDGIMRVLLK